MPRRQPNRRRNNPFAAMGPNRHAAPAPIVETIPKPDVALLTEAYEWMQVDEVVGYRLAYEWYVNSVPALLYKDPLDADQQRMYDKAVKAQALGDSATLPAEKIAGWAMALRLFERIWPNKGLPKFESKPPVSQIVRDVETVLSNLNGAFSATGVRFRMTFNKDREYHPGEIMIPKAELLNLVTQPPLQVALAEATTVAQTLSIVRTPDPVTNEMTEQFDGGQFMTRLPQVLGFVYQWVSGNDSKLTKPVGKGVPTPKPAKVKVSAAGAASASGPKGPITRTKRWTDSQIIRVIVPGNPFKGQMNAKYALVQDGQTIGEYKRVRRQANLGAGCGPIEAGVARGLLQVI